MKHNRIVSSLLAGCLLLTLTACGEAVAEEPETAGIAVQVEEVVSDTISTENRVSGKVAADNEATIFLGTSAKCTAVFAHAGDVVAAGDVICTLDLASALASYNAANISYTSAAQGYQDQAAVLQGQVDLTLKNVNDLKALFEIGAASQLEIDSAQLQYQSAVATRNATLAQLEAGMQNAKSGLEQLSTALENVDAAGNVIAPIAGTLVTMNAAENAFTSNAMPVAVIDGADQMKVTVSVSETLVPKLSIGDGAAVSVSAADQTFAATIRSVERAANMQTKLYTVTLTVPPETEGLLSGMFADVTFHTDTAESAVVVPSEAVLTSGDAAYVFVVEDGAASYRAVTTGLTGSGVTEILSGLRAGEQLVTVGQAYLEDGAAVRVVSGEA